MGEAMVVRLADGTSTEVDDVTELDWSSSPFLVLRTEQMVSCLFQADQVRSVTPRPPDPEDSAVIPIESLRWRLKAWCLVASDSGAPSAWMLEPRPTRTVNDGETGRCWICNDPADHGGVPHSDATGDGLTRYDIIDRLTQVDTEPCSDCRGQGGVYGEPCSSCFGTGELPKPGVPVLPAD